jgi:hypothetical protein
LPNRQIADQERQETPIRSAIAVTRLNHVEYVVFAVVYFLTEAPLLLGVVAVFRCWRRLPAPQVDLSRNPR